MEEVRATLADARRCPTYVNYVGTCFVMLPFPHAILWRLLFGQHPYDHVAVGMRLLAVCQNNRFENEIIAPHPFSTNPLKRTESR